MSARWACLSLPRLLGLVAVLEGCSSAPLGPERPAAPDYVVATPPESLALSPLPDALDHCSLSRALSSPTEIHVSPYGDDTRDGTSLANAVGTLDAAEALLPASIDSDYEVIVHDGSDEPELGGSKEYRFQQTSWYTFSSDYRIVIRAATGQTPVFDGRAPDESGPPRSFALHLGNEELETNITVQGLTIHNYAQIGIWVYSSCNRIYANHTRHIGDIGSACVWRDDPPTGDPLDVFDRPECTDKWTSGNLPTGCECVGYAGILVMHGDNNLVQHNDVIDSLNAPVRNSHVHAIYLANGASNNLVEDNYIRNVGGTPFKISSGSDKTPAIGNMARRNYLDRAGDVSFFRDDPKIGGPPSVGNTLDRNVATFPSFLTDNLLAEPEASFIFLNGQQTGKYYQGKVSARLEERVAASLVADVGEEPGLAGASQPEVFVALNYPELGFTKLVYKDAGLANTELRSVAFSSDEWQIRALAAGKFDSSGFDQVVMALQCTPGKAGCSDGVSRTKIIVGTMDQGLYSFDAGTTLYDVSGPRAWQVTAMTAGKFSDEASDTLIVAAKQGDMQQIFRGDGQSPQTGKSTPGVVAGSPLYSSDEWSVTAMTSGNIAGSARSLITAFRRNADASLSRVYVGDGVTGAAISQLFESDSQRITGLAFGRFGGAAPRLVTAFDEGTAQTVYVSDETSSDLRWRQLYTTPSWTISSLAAGNVDGDSEDDELVTGFDVDAPERPRLTRVEWGDGIAELGSGERSSGVSNGGEYYRSALEFPR